MPEPIANPTSSLTTAWKLTVAKAPQADAIIDANSDEAVSRAALDRMADEFAALVPADAARRRVAFALPNGSHWLACFLGLARTGATPVPLDPSEPESGLRSLAEAAGAAYLLRGDTFARAAATPARARADHALVKLTSGSSGTPKVYPFRAEHMLADGRQVCASMGVSAEDTNLAVIPFGHSYGLGNLIMPLLMQGTRLVCVDTPLPHALALRAARHRPTVFPAVPGLLRALAEADLPGDAFASLRTVISAGAPLPAATARAFFEKFGLKPHGFYGSSETGGIAYDAEGDDTLDGSSIGRPMTGVTVEPRPGMRIRVRSAAVFRASGHVTADRATIGPDGRIVLRGRVGRMVKIGGRRIDLGDLEASLRRIPEIADAFAAPHPDDEGQIAAVLATSLSQPAARALLRSQLAPWKMPRRIIVVTALPLTARGKPDGKALKEMLAR